MLPVLDERLLVSAARAARMLGIDRSHFYKLHSSGRLGPTPIRLGRRVLWNVDELRDWVAAKCPVRQVWLLRKEQK